MLRLRPVARDYPWGSVRAIPDYLGLEPTGGPIAELWFGAHPSAPSGVGVPAPTGSATAAQLASRVQPARPAVSLGPLSGPPVPLAQQSSLPALPGGRGAAPALAPRGAAIELLRPVDGDNLERLIAADPIRCLGEDVHARFGARLPYLLKLIAPARPLSLQVHPSIERARAGFELEEAAGIPVGASHRNYRDTNHKPELIYALTTFDAVSGFRAPRRAAEVLQGLDAPLARTVLAFLRADPTADGVREAFTYLLSPATRPSPEDVRHVVEASAARLRAGSPSPRADGIVALLASFFRGDPGVVASLLLNPVTLRPGQAMFIPAGGVHAYLGGVGVELMANSDNVLRAALTEKHVDARELFDVVDFIAAPPIRIAPEEFRDSTKVFYAPVDDFELSVTDVDDDEVAQPLPGRGPRIVLCLEGDVRLVSAGESMTLNRGQSVFVPAADGPLTVRGCGTVVQADVP